jgi:hypothetical protein
MHPPEKYGSGCKVTSQNISEQEGGMDQTKGGVSIKHHMQLLQMHPKCFPILAR